MPLLRSCHLGVIDGSGTREIEQVVFEGTLQRGFVEAGANVFLAG